MRWHNTDGRDGTMWKTACLFTAFVLACFVAFGALLISLTHFDSFADVEETMYKDVLIGGMAATVFVLCAVTLDRIPFVKRLFLCAGGALLIWMLVSGYFIGIHWRHIMLLMDART